LKIPNWLNALRRSVGIYVLKQIDSIVRDLESLPLIFAGVRKHGKTTSLKTITKYIRETRPNWIIKAFDISLAWWHQSPLKYRQLVDEKTYRTVENIGDCLYEIGRLNDRARRTFIATIINNNFLNRYKKKLEDSDFEDNYPWVLYIFEEGNTYWQSQSLNKKDWPALTLKDFISAGRNYKQACVLVATRVSGEVSPGYRNRCFYLLGKIVGAEERTVISKATNSETLKIARSLPQYHFVYYNGSPSEVFRIRDEVKSVPQDFIAEKKKKKRSSFFNKFK